MKNYYAVDQTYYPNAIVSELHKDVSCPRHMHIAPEIVMVISGTLHMRIDDEEYAIPNGTCAFIPSLTPHEFINRISNTCRVITFAKEILFDFVSENHVFRVKKHLFTPNAIFYDLVEFYLKSKISTGDIRLARAVLTPIVYEISSSCEFINSGERENDAFISVLEYLSENYKEELDLEAVAARVGVHPVSLSRMFGARTGISFVKFIRYLRSTAAANLISKSNMTLTEIAYTVGFGSVRSFNRAFLEIYQITPSKYRDIYKNV